MNINTQKFLILGVSKSGFYAAKLLLGVNNKPFLYEEKTSEKILSKIKELSDEGAVVVNKEGVEEAIKETDVLIISPGVKINHEVSVMAKSFGKRIISEAEFGFIALSPEIIAVTGTNGKTTTVSLINEIYKKSGRKSLLLGNVGIPVTSTFGQIEKNSVCVTELSSFQLESTTRLTPHIACVLNVTPDHLERHFTFENYVYLKKRIFQNQTESEYTVLNYDDDIVKNFAEETNGKIVWVSANRKVDGAYCEKEKIFYKEEYLMEKEDLSLKGEHNLYNALFALACAKIDGIANNDIVKALSAFNGVSHRIELVNTVNGIKFYDDSKSTNTASTISALHTVKEPVVLLLGGREKGEKYDELFTEIKKLGIKEVVLYGESRFNMLESAGKIGVKNISLTQSFFSALLIASVLAEKGDAVLLSPACSSFDQFSCFEERGDKFKEFSERLK